jgi:hypothetical protein
MKSKFLVGVVTFISTIILIIFSLNIFDSNSKKTYFFNRKFSNDTLFSFEKNYSKMNKREYVNFICSDSLFIEQDKNDLDLINNSYNIYFSDKNLQNKFITKIILPLNSNFIYCNEKKLYYTLKFKFYEYDFKMKTSNEILLDNFKIRSIKPLINSQTKFICFGEYFEKNCYKSGFYIIDIYSKKIIPSKIVKSSFKTSMPGIALSYSGNFSASWEKSKLVYCCDKYSKIYFFDKNGKYLRELTTNDKIPLPVILTNQKGDSFYSRGGTWASNCGIIIREDLIYVFSARSIEESTIIVDEYSYNTLKYIQSFRIKYNNLNSRSIKNVFFNKNKILITFEFNYASFIFSRHI